MAGKLAGAAFEDTVVGAYRLHDGGQVSIGSAAALPVVVRVAVFFFFAGIGVIGGLDRIGHQGASRASWSAT